MRSRLLLPAVVVTLTACSAPTPSPSQPALSPSPSYSAEVDRLFAEAESCRTTLAGRSVRITYPAAWSTNEAMDGLSPCLWFGPHLEFPEPLTEAPDGVVITFGAVSGPAASAREPLSHAETTVAGRPAWRNEELLEAADPQTRYLVYWILLGGTPTEGPNLVVRSAAASDDPNYGISTAVLDRMMQMLAIESGG